MNTLKVIKFKEGVISFLLFIVLVGVVTYPLIFRMNSSIYGPFFNTDIRGAVWSQWWLKQSIVQHGDFFFCPYIAAPFGVDTHQSPHSSILLAVVYFLSYFMEPIFLLNFLTLLTFALTGLFSFYLMLSLVRDKYISFLCACIFTFSPYHLNKVMEFTYVFLANWFVIYIYFLLKLREKFTLTRFGLAVIALALTLAFNFYYGFFAFIFTLWFLLFCLAYQWKRGFIKERSIQNLHFLYNVACLWLAALLINLSTFLGIANVLFSSQLSILEKSALGFSRLLSYLSAQSARPLSYFLPASTHPVFGGFTKQMFGSIFYGRGSIEQTLYLGWVPLILTFLAFRGWRHKRSHTGQYPDYQASQENFYIGFFIFSACFAFICSMPPYMDLLFFKIYFPSYFFYKVLPMFRAYARFGILVSLSVSVLAGFGLKFIFERMINPRRKQLFTAAVCLFILFEFTNVPPLRVTDISKVPSVYKWLGEQKEDFIVAEYPMAMTSPGEAFENYDYLFYQTKHQKRLLNGAVAGTEAFEIRKKILKVNNPETINILKGLGVKYVILHTDLYKEGDYGNAVDVVGEIPRLDNIAGWDLIKTFGSVYVYDIGNKPWREEIDAS